MLTAFSVSVVFLACYLIYHFNAGIVYYQKTGLLRYVYLTILTTHTHSGGDHAGARDHHAAARPAHGCEAASRHRALDVSDLDVCECDGGGRVPYVVSVVGEEYEGDEEYKEWSSCRESDSSHRARPSSAAVSAYRGLASGSENSGTLPRMLARCSGNEPCPLVLGV